MDPKMDPKRPQMGGPPPHVGERTQLEKSQKQGEWQHGLFTGCFDNCMVCILAYCCPCYVFGKNAETVGRSCCLCGLAFFVPILNWVCGVNIRGKIRDQQNIEGGCCTDFLAVFFCMCCSQIQAALEMDSIGDSGPPSGEKGSYNMDRE